MKHLLITLIIWFINLSLYGQSSIFIQMAPFYHSTFLNSTKSDKSILETSGKGLVTANYELGYLKKVNNYFIGLNFGYIPINYTYQNNSGILGRDRVVDKTLDNVNIFQTGIYVKNNLGSIRNFNIDAAQKILVSKEVVTNSSTTADHYDFTTGEFLFTQFAYSTKSPHYWNIGLQSQLILTYPVIKNLRFGLALSAFLNYGFKKGESTASYVTYDKDGIPKGPPIDFIPVDQNFSALTLSFPISLQLSYDF